MEKTDQTNASQVMANEIKKIVVIGPESTGKSTLCKMLANHFNALWVEEYAREYLLTNGNKYTYEDLQIIAAGQIQNEEQAIHKLLADPTSKLLFIDTDMYVMKVWSEFVFNRCDQTILHTILTRKYDLYLLCQPDIPWVKDELREYPDLQIREQLYHHYKEILINQSVPWINISGNYEERLETSIKEVNRLFY